MIFTAPRRLAVALVPVVLGSTAWAQSDAQPLTRVGLEAESSHLSNGSPDWRETTLRITRSMGKNEVKSLALTQTNRFALDDHELSGLIATRLSPQLTASATASISPTHRVLAKNTFEGALQYEFAPAWLIHSALGRKNYNSTRVNQGLLMLEHYFSDFSASVAWKPVRSSGVGSSSAELRLAWYYSDTDSVGLIHSTGKEVTTITPGNVVLTDVRSTALQGRHWLSRQWVVNYGLSHTRQGSFYNRRSARLGVEYVF